MSDSQVYGNEVKITDANGDPFVADPTGAFATTTELQEAIHRGNAYSFDVDGTIGIDTSIYLSVVLYFVSYYSEHSQQLLEHYFEMKGLSYIFR